MNVESKKTASAPLAPDGFEAGLSWPDDEFWVPLNSDSMHDLAGPVNQVRCLASLLFKKTRGRTDMETDALFTLIQNSADRLQELIGGLDRYKKVVNSPCARRLSSANLLAAGAIESVRQSIDQSGASVSYEPLPDVFCDPALLTIALASVIENSIKFRGPAVPEVRISAITREDAWIFSIADNGIGIGPKYRSRIFGIFKRVAPESYPGAGVGLAVVRWIIERHGGRVWVDSEPGHGATFSFSLPREEYLEAGGVT